MPLYTFYCSKCNEKFEKFLTIKSSTEIKTTCDKCGEPCEHIVSRNINVINMSTTTLKEKLEKVYEMDQKRYNEDPDFRANFHGWGDKEYQKRVDDLIEKNRKENEKSLRKFKEKSVK